MDKENEVEMKWKLANAHLGFRADIPFPPF